MNRSLMTSIVDHVFASFGVVASDFVNFDKSDSLLDKKWLLLNVRIAFEGDLEISTGQIWGCQFVSGGQEVKVILGNCSQDKQFKEYALLVQLKDGPCYGLYSAKQSIQNIEPMLACSVNGKEWIECNTFLQASFLSGMEQIKDSGFSWNKCTSYQKEFEKLLSFIQYHQLVYGATDEGQEV